MKLIERLLVFVLAFAAVAAAQVNPGSELAPTPPMGWNSWDAYGLTITEAQFRENLDVLARVLKPFGYNYAVIDEGWFLSDPEQLHTGHVRYEMDSFGRYVPVPARFPSALRDGKNMGFQAIGADVHARGLKFGIHIVRGIPKEALTQNAPIFGSHFHAGDAADTNDACPWDPTNWGVRDTPAGQAWYDSLLQQYAGWGVDFIKVDCVSDHPYKPHEIRMIRDAIRKTGRPMVLSLSPGPTSTGRADEVARYAQMWRISDDIWDRWIGRNDGVYFQFPLAAAWTRLARPGAWPDADMLPLGYLGPAPGDGQARDTQLTHDEQQTLLTLWSMARSPLIIGANLTKLDPWTLGLLTNRDVLAIDQDGRNQMQQSREHDMVAWTSQGAQGQMYLALFNLGDRERKLDRPFTFYGAPAGELQIADLWNHTILPRSSSVQITLAPHSSVLYRLKL